MLLSIIAIDNHWTAIDVRGLSMVLHYFPTLLPHEGITDQPRHVSLLHAQGFVLGLQGGGQVMDLALEDTGYLRGTQGGTKGEPRVAKGYPRGTQGAAKQPRSTAKQGVAKGLPFLRYLLDIQWLING